MLKENYEKLFCSMDSFWWSVAGESIDLNWSLKLKLILITLRRNKNRISSEDCLVFLEIGALRKWIWSDSISTSHCPVNPSKLKL